MTNKLTDIYNNTQTMCKIYSEIFHQVGRPSNIDGMVMMVDYMIMCYE